MAGTLVEIAVLYAATGAVLPTAAPSAGPLPRQDRPRTVDARRAGGRPSARDWDKVLRRLRAVTRRRFIIPCDPVGDPARIAAVTARAGKRLMHLADPGSWAPAADGAVTAPIRPLSAREGAARACEELHRLAADRGRHYPPLDPEPPYGPDRRDQARR